MSFAFGFAGDDIEDDGVDMVDASSSGEVSAKPSSSLVQPKMHALSDLVSPGRTRLRSWCRSMQAVVLAITPAY